MLFIYLVYNKKLGNSGNVSGSAQKNQNGQYTLTLKWEGTGNSKDNYKIYQGYGSYQNLYSKSINAAVACSVTSFLTEIPSSVISSVGNNQYEAVIPGLQSNQIYTFIVIVFQTGGYMAAYNPFQFNDSFLLAIPFFMINLVILFLIFI
jgi:hypothetical protein